MLPKMVRLSWLLDFYGPLLTERQRQMAELHWHHDLSLGEIAEQFAVSRQAVHDTLRRAQTQLEEYERKLRLLAKFRAREDGLASLQDVLTGPGTEGERLARARRLLADLLAEERDGG